MSTIRKPTRLGGVPIDQSCHVCGFFRTNEEAYEVLMPFIKEGIEEGERALHIIDPSRLAGHRSRLEAAGIGLKTAEKNGQLEIVSWYDAHLRNNQFRQDAMISFLKYALTQGREDGYPQTRLVANMEWSLEEWPGVQDLVEYEARVNYVLPKYGDPVICAYDLSKFSAAIIMNILRTHPMAIVGGILQSNPFYVPPNKFLLELQGQRWRNDLTGNLRG